MQHTSANPRIRRLTPLDKALEVLNTLTPLALPQRRALTDVIGAVAAEDVKAPSDLPTGSVAYADGWAVNASDVIGASSYSAAVISPPPDWVNADDAMPNGFDAVLPPDTVTIVSPGAAEASAPVAHGEGVRRTGQDMRRGALVIVKGTRLGPRHAGIMGACGIDALSVRVPKVRIVTASEPAARQLDMLSTWLTSLGAEIADTVSGADEGELARHYASSPADITLSLGGTGQGMRDCAVAALAKAGEVALHGVALRPGESTALGKANGKPVILLPGRIDGLIAGALVFVTQALANTSGLSRPSFEAAARLIEKANSTIGFAELFLGVPEGADIRPVPLNEASFDMLSRAAGWFTVPAGSEGLQAGQIVHLIPFQPR